MRFIITVLAFLSIINSNAKASEYILCSGSHYFGAIGWEYIAVVIKKMNDGRYLGTRNNGRKKNMYKLEFLPITEFKVSENGTVFTGKFDAKITWVRLDLNDRYGEQGSSLEQDDYPPIYDVNCFSSVEEAWFSTDDENVRKLIEMN